MTSTTIDEDDVTQGVADQGDRGVLALDAGHGLLVQEDSLLLPPPPQDPWHAMGQDPDRQRIPRKTTSQRGEDVADELSADEVTVDVLAETP